MSIFIEKTNLDKDYRLLVIGIVIGVYVTIIYDDVQIAFKWHFEDNENTRLVYATEFGIKIVAGLVALAIAILLLKVFKKDMKTKDNTK